MFISTAIGFLPELYDTLAELGQETTFLNFLQMASEGTFPLNNISYILFLDGVKWFAIPVTSQMRYAPEAMKFWKT